MAITNFSLQPETATPAEQELILNADAEIDYEVPAQRKQRGIIKASRAESSSVTAKNISRGFVLDVSNIDEKPRWTRDLPVLTMQVAANLAPLTETLNLKDYAQDDEGDFFTAGIGTLSPPSGNLIVAETAGIVTANYRNSVNPSSNQSFNLPVYLEQPSGTKVTGSDRTLSIRVNRFAPRPIYSQFASPQSAGRLYIDHNTGFFAVNLDEHIQNHSQRPILYGYTAAYLTTFSTALADFTIGPHEGHTRLVGTRKSNFPFTTIQTANLVIRAKTNDVGDESEVYLNYILRVEP